MLGELRFKLEDIAFSSYCIISVRKVLWLKTFYEYETYYDIPSLSDGPLPSVLQEVSVPVINNSVCETMYRSAGYIEHIPEIFICAGWKKGGFDSCEVSNEDWESVLALSCTFWDEFIKAIEHNFFINWWVPEVAWNLSL